MGGFSSILRGFAPTQTGPTSWLDYAGQAIDIYRRSQVPAVRTPTIPTLPIPGVGQPPYDLTKLPRLPGSNQLGFRFGLRSSRRMNVCNMRALNRALRRVRGFEKKARRVLTITTGKKVRTKFKRQRKCS